MGKSLYPKEAVELLDALAKKDSGALADFLRRAGIEELTDIERLDLSGTPLTVLPAEIGQLTNLQWLDLSGTPLTVLPAEIGQLTNLQWLGLSGTSLTALPAEIGQLTNLQRLDLGGTSLTVLPAEIGQLTNLQWLNLSGTPLTALPAEIIGQLTNLQWLDLSYTSLTALPAEIGQLTNLQVLYLRGTPLTALPAEIGQLTNLQVLFLTGTPLTVLPAEIGQLTNLQTLFLSGTPLTVLPAEIGQLTNLQTLDLSGASLTALPAETGQLTNLQTLDLCGTPLTALPAEIGRLTNLRWLDLSYTSLTALPAEIRQLRQLHTLVLDKTNIHFIPSWIKELPSLKRFSINGLTLKAVPREVFDLDLPFFLSTEDYRKQYSRANPSETEKGIVMEGTVLKTQPVGLFALDRAFLRAYFDEPKVPVREGKVIFLGDGGGGKSHTIERILKGGRDEGIDTAQTPGINIKTWEPDCGEQKVKINFWDFGGQEILHAMHRCFLTGRSLYVVVLRERSQSRHNDLTLQARYWLENISSFAPDCPVILAVNREQGVAGSTGVNSSLLQSEFKGIVGEPIVYCAREDRDDNFEALTKAIRDQALLLDSTEMEFPISWNKVRSALDNMSNRRGRRGSKYYIDKVEYKKLCTAQGIRDENIQRWLLEWFNDLGVCFSYHQEEGKELERYQVLNPEWLTNAIYAIINIGKRPEFSANGVITRGEIHAILSDPSKYEKERTAQTPIKYEETEQGYVLDIMRKFSLCEEIDVRNYFIPALCSPETPPNFRPCADEYTEHTRFEFRYSFLPDSVIHRLMIECIRAGFHRKAACFSGIRVDFEPDEVVMTAEAVIAKNTLAVDLYHRGDLDASRNKLSWARRKVSEINHAMNLKPEHEILVVCDGENRADLRLDTLFKLHERGRHKTDLSAYKEDEIVECDLDDALRLLYGDRVVKRADRIRKKPAEREKISFRDALARAEAEKERGEEELKTGKDVNFLLGVSFAGEQREFVRGIMKSLRDDGGFAKHELFFDEWYEYLINGANADIALDTIYSGRCKKVVVLFSEAYLEKHWTNKLEWRRAITKRITEDPENVCLLRFGDVDIDSIPLLHGKKDIVKDVSKMTPEETAEFIQKWYDRPSL